MCCSGGDQARETITIDTRRLLYGYTDITVTWEKDVTYALRKAFLDLSPPEQAAMRMLGWDDSSWDEGGWDGAGRTDAEWDGAGRVGPRRSGPARAGPGRAARPSLAEARRSREAVSLLVNTV